MHRLFDFGLLGVLFVAPLFMGGRHPLGQLVFVALVCATFLAWMLGKCLDRSQPCWIRLGVWPLLLGGLGVVSLQLFPLPQAWLSALSPALNGMLPAWSAEGVNPSQLGTWAQLSLAPEATRNGLIMYVAYAILFLLVAQRIQRVEDIEQILRWVVVASLILSAIALLQYFVGNGRFLWVYAHPFRMTTDAVKGPFANQNHFAHYLALAMGPLIWWTRRAWSSGFRNWQTQSSRQTKGQEWDNLQGPAAILALCVAILAALLTFSRGGIVAILVSVIVCIAAYASRSLIRAKVVLPLLAAVCVVGAGVSFYGRDALTYELSTISEAESIEQLASARKDLWAADLLAANDFPLLGTGVGTHSEVYPKYMKKSRTIVFSHAENGYLQILMESGLVGLGLMLTGITLCGWWCFKAYRQSSTEQELACLGAILGALIASVVHAFVDFAWYIPACMSLTVVFAACACRLFQLTKPETDMAANSIPLPRAGWMMATVAVAGCCSLMIPPLVGPARAAQFNDDFSVVSSNEDIILEQDIERIDQCIRSLQSLLHHDPKNARAHLQLASLWLAKFELEQSASDNPMPLNQIRDVAQKGQFASRQALNNWLSAATSDRCDYLRHAQDHSRQALELCPLLGEAYIFTAETAFLEGWTEEEENSYIDQALKVRPYSAPVQFAAGCRDAQAGELEDTIKHFQVAFDQDNRFRSKIIALLGQQNADFFFQHFNPDRLATLELMKHYKGQNKTSDLRAVQRRYVAMLEQEAEGQNGPTAANLWRQIQGTWDALGDQKKAMQAAQMAFRLAPNDYQSRRNLATRLIENEQYEKAVEHLNWCLLRYPNNDQLRKDLALSQQHLRMAESAHGKYQ